MTKLAWDTDAQRALARARPGERLADLWGRTQEERP